MQGVYDNPDQFGVVYIGSARELEAKKTDFNHLPDYGDLVDTDATAIVMANPFRFLAEGLPCVRYVAKVRPVEDYAHGTFQPRPYSNPAAWQRIISAVSTRRNLES